MQGSYRGGEQPIFSNGFIIQRGSPVIIAPNLMPQEMNFSDALTPISPQEHQKRVIGSAIIGSLRDST